MLLSTFNVLKEMVGAFDCAKRQQPTKSHFAENQRFLLQTTVKANRYLKEYGLRLLPSLYEVYNPMPYDGARDMEVELAISLREAGYGVWQV